jgi:hypothetical protein
MRLSHLMLLFALLFAALAPAPKDQATGLAGHWEGKIQMPEREVAFAVDVAPGAGGGWIGSLSVAGSPSIDVPLDSITVSGGAVKFTAALPGTTNFEGTISADATTLTGKVANHEGAVPFQLARNGEPRVKLPPPSSPSSKEFEGRWEGVVDAGGTLMRMVLQISPAPDGTARATLINLDKGNVEIPASTVTIQGKQLDLEIRLVGGTYRGTLGASGEIAGELAQQSVRLPLTFKRQAAVAK